MPFLIFNRTYSHTHISFSWTITVHPFFDTCVFTEWRVSYTYVWVCVCGFFCSSYSAVGYVSIFRWTSIQFSLFACLNEFIIIFPSTLNFRLSLLYIHIYEFECTYTRLHTILDGMTKLWYSEVQLAELLLLLDGMECGGASSSLKMNVTMTMMKIYDVDTNRNGNNNNNNNSNSQTAGASVAVSR